MHSRNIPGPPQTGNYQAIPRRNERRTDPASATVTWCAGWGETYTVLEMIQRVTGTAASPISEMYQAVKGILDAQLLVTDGVINYLRPSEGVAYQYVDPKGWGLQVWNTDSHQVTYGVLRAAVNALYNFNMLNEFGSMAFIILDGNNQVASGALQYVLPPG